MVAHGQGMQRIVVVGTSCSGKTTFAGRLAAQLHARHVELDALYWLPGWESRPIEEFRARVSAEVLHDRWVIDGNYSRVRDIVWSRATHLVWLNYPLPQVFGRALHRSVRRAWSGEELFSGNVETLGRTFFHRDSILLWVLRSFHRRRRTYRKLLDERAFPQLEVLELRRPAEAADFLRRLTTENAV